MTYPQGARTVADGGEGRPADRTPLQVGAGASHHPALTPLSKPANVAAMTTKLVSGESLNQTQDLHIVVAAVGGQTNRALIGHTAISAPLTWHEAQKLWDRLDTERRGRIWTDREGRVHYGSHILHYMVRSIEDPRWAALVGRGYADARDRKDPSRPAQYGDRGRVKAAKAWAKDHGYKGAGGGWIYGPNGKPFCQGWDSLAHTLMRREAIKVGSDGKWYVIDRPMVP